MTKLGVIGCGGMGSHHAKTVHDMDNVKLVGVADTILADRLGQPLGDLGLSDQFIKGLWTITAGNNRVLLTVGGRRVFFLCGFFCHGEVPCPCPPGRGVGMSSCNGWLEPRDPRTRVPHLGLLRLRPDPVRGSSLRGSLGASTGRPLVCTVSVPAYQVVVPVSPGHSGNNLDSRSRTGTVRFGRTLPITDAGARMSSQAERLRKRLERTRGFSSRLLEDFSTPEEWTMQLHEGGNHAIWFVGHMGTTDNFMISILSPDRDDSREEFTGAFGMVAIVLRPLKRMWVDLYQNMECNLFQI